MRVSIILDSDQARQNAGYALGPNCLKTLHASADDKSSQEGRELKVIIFLKSE